MRELAGQYPRYGYRKIRIFLKRQRQVLSPERTYRLWRQAGFASAETPAAAAHRHGPPPSTGADGDQSRLSV